MEDTRRDVLEASARELAESWGNGNHSHVLDEVTACCRSDDRGDVATQAAALTALVTLQLSGLARPSVGSFVDALVHRATV